MVTRRYKKVNKCGRVLSRRNHGIILINPHQHTTTDIPSCQAGLDQSICVDGSPFRHGWNVTTIKSTATILTAAPPQPPPETAVRIWTTRLVYLAVLYQQNRAALPEYRYRRQLQSQTTSPAHNIFEQDYECPSANYLAYALDASGLGANMKTGAYDALRVAITMDRQLLLLNGMPRFQQRQYFRDPWPLVSCPRHGFQCFFLPLSPCVPTLDQVQNATLFRGPKGLRTVFVSEQNFSNSWADQRILIFPRAHTRKEPKSFRFRLVDFCREMINEGLIPNSTIINKAVDRILHPPTGHLASWATSEAGMEIEGALMLYLMRPQTRFWEQLQIIQKTIFEEQRNVTRSLGLPIRGEL
eukprot:scaffold133_cov169-Amphora_coffeaeformis.AAC.10